MRLTRAELLYNLSGDDQVFRDLEKAPYTGFWWPDEPMAQQLWDFMVETCLKCEVGEITAQEAGDALHRRIRESPLPPAAFGATLSKPAATTVTRTSSPKASSTTAPKHTSCRAARSGS